MPHTMKCWPFCSNAIASRSIPCMLQSLRRYQITRPGRSPPGDLHCYLQPYVTSIAADAEAAMQQVMGSARKMKTALMMNDGIV